MLSFSTRAVSKALPVALARAASNAVPLSNVDGGKTLDYGALNDKLTVVRERLNRPLTQSEKLLYSHMVHPESGEIVRGKSFLDLNPDRVILQDATAQMATLQFISAGLPTVAVPTSIHCDHLIQARDGAESDLSRGMEENKEVFDFLSSAAKKFGMHFYKPGAGIIHQVALENLIIPGMLVIGTDSHTVNGGGIGSFSVGVGGADALDAMVGLPWVLKTPKVIGVHLTGELNGWSSAKDVILKVADILTVSGGTGAVVEYFGEGVNSISATGMGTITNMGAEIGATTSVFPVTDSTLRYLHATNRGSVADVVSRFNDEVGFFKADEGAPYDQVIEINLSELEPMLNGPFTPDLATPVSQIAERAEANGWPVEVSASLIGSCTNSSFEDMSRAASLAQQALDAGVKSKVPFLITPGSEQVRATIEAEGLVEIFEAAGGKVLANACGPCIGQWDRDVEGPNSIVTSYNRNFTGRNDGNPETHAFVTSPEVCVAMAFSGKFFDPINGTVDGSFKFEAPQGPELPPGGFVTGRNMYQAPAENPDDVEVIVAPDSERLQLLEPFQPWSGADFEDMPILVLAKGKVTTDHISAAGPWLRYRGHLENIANNTYIGVTNKDGKVNEATNQLTGETGAIPEVAKAYRDNGVDWIFVGGDNVGEGSSREHAALQPRFLGGKVALAKSFARIHETNLKKMGMLPLTFADAADYDKLAADDRISVVGLNALAPEDQVTIKVTRANGESFEIKADHTLNADQIEWFKAGSALNFIKKTL
ncbi:aconitate hydratase [Thecamonas trahens ATCC 50062]|uniref:Aconitate hydratase, mitochondrial n=1 Tax=Thecamonas trahens ATCC 50062 TaxID=461836 RepID=A0A0L0D8D0_THETB|nr:aconitate hydratase [Thecamonas trahens ATCC 50062]KNC48336.1 aconitate hydratase [Thecamonas trahens ATCC 50062]|eukprot:XP_013758461.1 aconitate hydratase [Thecamonas trahens ATCC 50062]